MKRGCRFCGNDRVDERLDLGVQAILGCVRSSQTMRFMLWDGRLPFTGHDEWLMTEGSMSVELVAIDLGKQSFLYTA